MAHLPIALIRERQRGRNKFGARRTPHAGRRYASKAEADYAAELDLLARNGEVLSWQPQVRLDLKVNGHLVTRHHVDFVVTLADGREQIHEVKGSPDRQWPTVRNLMVALGYEVLEIRARSRRKLHRRRITGPFD